MAVKSRKEDRIFFSNKEGTAGTPNTTCRFEGRGLMTFPEPDYMHESDYGKLGSGEHGKQARIQALVTPWSYKTQHLSEIAYMLSFFQGVTDNTWLAAAGVTMHELKHLRVIHRTLPTFSFEYGRGGAGMNSVMAGNVVTSFSIVLAAGGNGVVDATFNGYGNRHSSSYGDFSKLSNGNMSTGTLDFSAEPLVNYKSCMLWIASALEGSFGITSVSTIGEDLGASSIDLTTLFNSITFGGDNGLTPADKTRAGGYGIANDYTRGDRRFTVEIALRKDVSVADIDAYILADTARAMELQFTGPAISGAFRYAMQINWPVLQFIRAPEDDETPVGKTYTTEVFEDSDGNSMLAYFQTAVAAGYNS